LITKFSKFSKVLANSEELESLFSLIASICDKQQCSQYFIFLTHFIYYIIALKCLASAAYHAARGGPKREEEEGELYHMTRESMMDTRSSKGMMEEHLWRCVDLQWRQRDPSQTSPSPTRSSDTSSEKA
jgi:hypothetical protein